MDNEQENMSELLTRMSEYIMGDKPHSYGELSNMCKELTTRCESWEEAHGDKRGDPNFVEKISYIIDTIDYIYDYRSMLEEHSIESHDVLNLTEHATYLIQDCEELLERMSELNID